MSRPTNLFSANSIAFFLQDLDGGGTERAIVGLAGEIAKQGYAVDLVVGDAESDYRAEVSPEIHIVDFSARSRLVVFYRLISYLHHRKPAVVMSALDPPNILLVIAARLTGYKGRIVISQRAVLDASLRELGFFRRMIMKLLQRFCFPHADALVSNSHAATRELVMRLEVPSKKVFTIHNAIDIDRIKLLANEPLGGNYQLEIRFPFILSIGSLSKRKDMPTLIKAFALIKEKMDVSLAILGKGQEKQRIEDLISHLGLSKSVHLLGFDSNPYKWIKAAAVIVSSSKEEGFPNVIAEALALGGAIVATDCPGDTGELLGHGKWGRLVPIGNPEQMAEAILDALNEKYPLDVRVRAEEFSPSKITSAYLNVLLPNRYQ